jgi:predicted alpha/beta-fold hydrolase
MYAYVRARCAPVPLYSRRRWETPDGDFIDVDRIAGPADAPLVVLFHGLEGNSASHYARTLSAHMAQAGWRLAIPHFRGCSGEPNRLARAYHSGDSAEIGWMLGQFAAESQGSPLAAVGVSLGGNALLKYLGEAGRKAPGMLRCAVAVSAPLDLTAAGDILGRGSNRLYARLFLATLKKKGAAKAARFPGLLDVRMIRRARTLRGSTMRSAPLWVPQHGRLLALPTQASCLALRVRVCCWRLNDPFLPRGRCRRGPGVGLHRQFPEHGGHVGFTSGPSGGSTDSATHNVLHPPTRHSAQAYP